MLLLLLFVLQYVYSYHVRSVHGSMDCLAHLALFLGRHHCCPRRNCHPVTQRRRPL